MFRTWAGRFQRERVQQAILAVEARPGDEATETELDLSLEDWASAELKRVVADFYHALILFCKGKALKVALTNKEGEGFEAWRALVNRYEPSKVNVVGKLAEILRTPFEGDLLDAITTFERKVTIYEAQSREAISDSLEIGCVVAGMGQSSMREHLLLSATKCDSWSKFVREVESIEHAKKTISAPSPMDIDSFQGNSATSAENTDTLPKSVGLRAKEEQRSLHVRSAEKDIMDNIGHESTHHPTKIHRKEDGKVIEMETAREHRRVASPKEEKVEAKRKAEAKE